LRRFLPTGFLARTLLQDRSPVVKNLFKVRKITLEHDPAIDYFIRTEETNLLQAHAPKLFSDFEQVFAHWVGILTRRKQPVQSGPNNVSASVLRSLLERYFSNFQQVFDG